MKMSKVCAPCSFSSLVICMSRLTPKYGTHGGHAVALHKSGGGICFACFFSSTTTRHSITPHLLLSLYPDLHVKTDAIATLVLNGRSIAKYVGLRTPMTALPGEEEGDLLRSACSKLNPRFAIWPVIYKSCRQTPGLKMAKEGLREDAREVL